MAPTDVPERAAELIERLLTDRRFRAEFRRSPARLCAEYELDDVAADFERDAKALFTLDRRESRSSLAGVLMAAAVEGVGVAELLGGLHAPHGNPVAAAALGRALSRTNLAAVPSPGAGAGAAAVVEPPAPAAGVEHHVDHAASAAAAAEPAGAPAPVPAAAAVAPVVDQAPVPPAVQAVLDDPQVHLSDAA